MAASSYEKLQLLSDISCSSLWGLILTSTTCSFSLRLTFTSLFVSLTLLSCRDSGTLSQYLYVVSSLNSPQYPTAVYHVSCQDPYWCCGLFSNSGKILLPLPFPPTFPEASLSLRKPWGKYLGIGWNYLSGATHYYPQSPPQRPRALNYFSSESDFLSNPNRSALKTGVDLLLFFVPRCPPQHPVLDHQSQLLLYCFHGTHRSLSQRGLLAPSCDPSQGRNTDEVTLGTHDNKPSLSVSLTKQDILN